MEHTPEPWLYFRIEPSSATSGISAPYSPVIADNGPRLVTGDKGAFVGIHADDYRRIVACVNACQHLDTEKLEKQNSEGKPMWQFVMEVCEQRDELLEALKRIADGPWPVEVDDPVAQCKFDEQIARAAIAKAEQ